MYKICLVLRNHKFTQNKNARDERHKETRAREPEFDQALDTR